MRLPCDGLELTAAAKAGSGRDAVIRPSSSWPPPRRQVPVAPLLEVEQDLGQLVARRREDVLVARGALMAVRAEVVVTSASEERYRVQRLRCRLQGQLAVPDTAAVASWTACQSG